MRRFVELDDGHDAAEIQAFGMRHDATFEGFPGQGYAGSWLGVRRAGGELAAVGLCTGWRPVLRTWPGSSSTRHVGARGWARGADRGAHAVVVAGRWG